MATAEVVPPATCVSEERSELEAARPSIDFQPGSDADFVRLYATSYAKILKTLVIRLGDSAAAEDCTQEAFEHAYRNWTTWKPMAPPEAWVNRIALNAAASYRRKMRLREVGEVIRRIGLPQAPDSDPQEITRNSGLIDGLATLTPKQSAALLLRHYHGYTNRAIAELLGIPERTFASRLASAKARMRLLLESSYADLPAPDRLPRSA
jgi:RNA polymerase sigma factor (sigma-70 family)